MKKFTLYFLLMYCLFFYSCSDDSNPLAPDTYIPDPVTIVSMNLDGVEDGFADDSELQETFKNNLASTLGMSDPDRIQILSVTESNQRGSVSIELLFLESESTDDLSITELLTNVVDIDTIGNYSATVELTVSDAYDSAMYMLAVADDALEEMLSKEYNCSETNELYDDCDDVDLMDFTHVHDLYLEAVAHDSENPGANFGAALTGLLTITQDPILQDFIDDFEQWEDFDNTYFPNSEGRNSGFSIDSGIPYGANSFLIGKEMNIPSFLPFQYLKKYYFENRSHTNSRDDNMNFSDMQDVIEDVFIARLTNSINYLDNVVDNDFVFEITPQMQQDLYQNSLEMDDTEFYLIKGYMHSLRYMLYTITAFDLDVGTIDDFGDLGDSENADFSFLEQDGSFLTLRSGSENNLPNAHNDLNQMRDALLNAYIYLENDVDTANDIVLWQDVAGQTIDFENQMYTMSEFLASDGPLHQFFNSDHSIDICHISDTQTGAGDCWYDYWNNGWYGYDCLEDCTSITLNISNFMTNPPSNLKRILPDYTVVVFEEDEPEYYEYYEEINIAMDLSECTLPQDEIYFAGWNVDYNTGEWGDCQHYCDCQPVLNYAQSIMNAMDTDNLDLQWGLIGFHIHGVWPDGTYDVTWEYSIDAYNTVTYYEPCVQWDTTDFPTWKSQWDITLGGLFPNMSNAVFFEDIMSVDDDDIQDSCDEDGYDYDCYYIDNPDDCESAGGEWWSDGFEYYCSCDY